MCEITLNIEKFSEIFFKVSQNSPENCINSLKKRIKFLWKLSESSLKIGDVFLKIWWNFVKNTLNSL